MRFGSLLSVEDCQKLDQPVVTLVARSRLGETAE